MNNPANKKSILFIGNYPPPYGGVPRHFEYLVPYLINKGWDVQVLSGGSTGVEQHKGFTVYKPNRSMRIRALLAAIFRYGYVFNRQMLKLMFNSFSDWMRYMIYSSLASKIVTQNNVKVISAYNLYSYAPIGALVSNRYNISLAVSNFGEMYSHIDFCKQNKKLIEYIIDTANTLLAMSQHCADSYSQLDLHPTVTMIPYGVDIEKFSPNIDGSSIRQQHGIADDANVVLFVGRMVKDMGLSTMLQAIPKTLHLSDNVIFVLVGEKGELTKTATELADRFPNNVFVATSVPFEQLQLYYAAASIVVAPTQGNRACGSLAAIEAMALGKPVIAANIGGIPEIVKHNITGILIPPNDTNALAKAIVNIFMNNETLVAMGAASRKRAEDTYDEHKVDQAHEQVFINMLQDK